MFKNQTKYEILLLNPLDVDHIWWLLGTSCPPKKISIEKTSNQMHQMINGGKDSHHAFPPRDGDINHHETPIRIWNSQIPWEWLIYIYIYIYLFIYLIILILIPARMNPISFILTVAQPQTRWRARRWGRLGQSALRVPAAGRAWTCLNMGDWCQISPIESGNGWSIMKYH